MARDPDAELLESVAVRRRRLRAALLLGRGRGHRPAPEGVAPLLVGAVLAALLCAGCVGWSFLSRALAEQRARALPVPTAPAWAPLGAWAPVAAPAPGRA